jgi:rhamnosyl/mannosyltransferase
LVPPRDTAALAAAVDRLWRQPEWAAGLGAAARERVAAEFSEKLMLDRHLALFETLLHPG